MVGRSSRAMGGAVLAVCACLPSSPPMSLLAEEAEVIGLSIEVVEPGPNSLDLLPIPADRTRSEALPGDRVRLTALIADESGVLDSESFEPLWVINKGLLRLAFDRAQELEPCEPSRPLLLGEACEAGRGGSIEFVMHDLAPEEPLAAQFADVLMVSGVDTPTDECFSRLLGDRRDPFWDCLVTTRSLNLGPGPRLVELMLEQGIPWNEEGEPLPMELPAGATRVTPDFAPQTPWVTLSRPGEVLRVWPDERTSLPAGALYGFTSAREPRDRQTFLRLRTSGLSISEEFVARRWHTTAVVFEGRQLRVPTDVDSFTMVVVTTDSRRSQTWSVFDFDVVPP